MLPLRGRVGELLGVPYADALDALEDKELDRALNLLRPQENSAGGVMGRRYAANQNAKTESLGRQTIEGVPAEGSRLTMTIPAGQAGNDLPIHIVVDNWFSPDLQSSVLSKHSDPRSGETVTRLLNISRGEPSRLLFEAPADYKVSESTYGMPRLHGGPGQSKQ